MLKAAHMSITTVRPIIYNPAFKVLFKQQIWNTICFLIEQIYVHNPVHSPVQSQVQSPESRFLYLPSGKWSDEWGQMFLAYSENAVRSNKSERLLLGIILHTTSPVAVPSLLRYPNVFWLGGLQNVLNIFSCEKVGSGHETNVVVSTDENRRATFLLPCITPTHTWPWY